MSQLKSEISEVRVLILCPYMYHGGGVARYYKVIKNHFKIKCDFLEIGRKEWISENVLKKTVNLVKDILKLYELLKEKHTEYNLVIINPSFQCRSIIRNGLFLRILDHYEKNSIVFFRGWSEKSALAVEGSLFRLFFSTYNRANAFIVLGSEMKTKLQNWGFTQPIYLRTTLVDDDLLKDFSIEKRLGKIKIDKKIRLLFLARIERRKGILETIEAFKILTEKYPNILLSIAGDGAFMEKVTQVANDHVIKDKIKLLGYISGDKKKKAFLNSDIFVFPTYHGEGMPNSVLEAMGFGLPVVTRPVGGLKDFFIDGQYGFLAKSSHPSEIANLIEKIIINANMWKKMSFNAHKYATENFLASKVAENLENTYIKTLSLEST